MWRSFLGSGSRVRYTPEDRRALDATQVAELRTTASRYPADRRLRRLIAELRAHSERFAGLWDSGAMAEPHQVSRKTVDHPQVGSVTLDCDVLSVTGSKLRIIMYTAEPGTQDAERLALLAVVGTQTFPGPR
ncbi:MmyB family transcriptional regulator [Streptomyces lydicus]|uniref:MmyB family transcriptional regulator n=1 Tax=Streptomyces lydicus TaxID=47763 RepID=UPI00379842F9